MFCIIITKIAVRLSYTFMKGERKGIRKLIFPMEQVAGIEPASSAWKADILAVIRYLHMTHFTYQLFHTDTLGPRTATRRPLASKS